LAGTTGVGGLAGVNGIAGGVGGAATGAVGFGGSGGVGGAGNIGGNGGNGGASTFIGGFGGVGGLGYTTGGNGGAGGIGFFGGFGGDGGNGGITGGNGGAGGSAIGFFGINGDGGNGGNGGTTGGNGGPAGTGGTGGTTGAPGGTDTSLLTYSSDPSLVGLNTGGNGGNGGNGGSGGAAGTGGNGGVGGLGGTGGTGGLGGQGGLGGEGGLAGTMGGDGGAAVRSEAGTMKLENKLAGVIEGGAGTTGTAVNGSGGVGVFLMGTTGGDTMIANFGTILGGASGGLGGNGGSGILINAGASVRQIINQGTILAGEGGNAFGIHNKGTITTLTNAQGGSTALSLNGNLPMNYNIVINTGTSYGKLAASDTGASKTTFGIDSSSVLDKRVLSYAGVISGISSDQFNNTATANGWWGRLSGGTWKLQADASNPTMWDLLFQFGPDAGRTLAGLRESSNALRSVMGQRQTDLAMMTSNDCQVFDASPMCMTLQARALNFGSVSQTSGALTLGYKVSDRIRIGGFVDYRANPTAPTGLDLANAPSLGAFAGYSENADMTGLQGKVLAAVNRTNGTTTRSNTQPDTEAGSGKASLNSYVVSAELGWGQLMAPTTVLITPFVGLRYTDTTRGAYNEGTLAGSVEYPIIFSKFYQRLTTAIVGLRVAGQLTDQWKYRVEAGFERDLTQRNSTYAGTSSIFELEKFAMASDASHNRTRSFASTSLTYELKKNHHLSGNISVRTQTYTSQTAVSAMGGYQIAF
jgi:hypothetical protein